MNSIIHKSKWGRIEIQTNEKESLFYIKAIGGITPDLLKKDYEELLEFSKKVESFDYIVDISKLFFAHPLNFKYLFKIKKHPKKRHHYVISSFWLQRFLARSFGWILTIDKVFSSFDEFQEYQSSTL